MATLRGKAVNTAPVLDAAQSRLWRDAIRPDRLTLGNYIG